MSSYSLTGQDRYRRTASVQDGFAGRLLTEDTFDGLNYQAGFTADAGDWQTVRIPLASFRPTFRGREVAGAPALDPARIRQVGLMIAERQAGPFALAMRWISLG